jgi:CheY-like chemotaxis protein
VLVVDDYPAVLESISRRLRLADFEVHEASTGEEAVLVAERHKPALALIDFRLPGINGVETALAIRKQGIHLPWILFSGAPDHTAAFEAGKVGALQVVWTPFNAYDVVVEAFERLGANTNRVWPRRPVRDRLPPQGTAAGVAAQWILIACDEDDDPSRIKTWAKSVGASYSQLRNGFSQLGINPHDARDFMRVLRAVWCVNGRIDHVASALAFGDARTMETLMDRAGFAPHGGSRASFDDFVRQQRFIASGHPVLQALQTLFAAL